MKRPSATTWPLLGLFVATLLVAAFSFVLSFHGLWEYGEQIMQLPGNLPFFVPAALDGAQLASVASIVATRTAMLRVRAYVWAVFGLTVVASMAGNAWYGKTEGLTWAGIVGTAVPPVLLAALTHVGIHVWRVAHPQPTPADKSTPARAKVVERQPKKKLAKTDKEIKVPQLQAEGLTQSEVAERLDTSIRTVARYWVKKKPKVELVPSMNGDAA